MSFSAPLHKTYSFFGIVSGLVAAGALSWLSASFSWWIPLAFLMVVALAYAAAVPRAVLYAALILTAAGQFGRIPPGSASGAFLALDVALVLLFLQWLLWWLNQSRTLSWRPIQWTWAGFLGVALVSLLANPFSLYLKDLAVDAFYWVRLLAYGSLLWIVPSLVRSADEKKKLLDWVVGIGMAVVGLGFVQLYLLPNIGVLSKYGWDPHVGRLVSSFLDPNYLGGYLALLLSLVLARTIREKRAFPWLSMLLILIATMLTYSRSGYLAVGIVLMLYGFRYSWKLMLVSILCILPIAWSIPRVQQRIAGGFSVDQTSRDRIDSWQNALRVTGINPVIGVGYNAYQAAQERLGILSPGSASRSAAGSDSSLLNVLATTGAVGLGLFLASVFLLLFECLRALRRQEASPRSSVALALLMAAPALFVHSFFVNSLFYPFILVTLSALGGILYAE